MSAVQTQITEATMPVMVNTELHAQVETAIKVRGLTKTYEGFEAVKGIDLDIAAGEIFGFIGPDGAGKTSVFQILGGVMQQTSGLAEMYGKATVDARSFVGYLTQTFSLYQDLSVAENLQYVGQLRMLTRKVIDERGHHYRQMFDMARLKDSLARSMIAGMKQKLALECESSTTPKYPLRS